MEGCRDSCAERCVGGRASALLTIDYHLNPKNRRSAMSNREFFLQLCSGEFPRFLGVLQATPTDRLEYRPHPRSRSGYELVSHMIGHELDLGELVETGVINHRVEVPFATMEEAMRIY